MSSAENVPACRRVSFLLLSPVTSYARGMPGLDARTPASEAIDDFIRHLSDRQFASSTRRIRRHFLEEYLQHAQQAAGSGQLTAGELMDPGRAAAWLADAADGKLRTRNTLRGPEAASYPNSMRVRIRSYNAFAEFLGLPDRRDNEPPARGFYLTPADTQRLLYDLTTRRPVLGDAAIALRTAAVAALVADTGRGVPELAGLDGQRAAPGRRGSRRTRRRSVPAQRPGRGDPHPVARSPGRDHRRTAGQRPWLPVDPGQARAAPGRPAAGQARPRPRGRADPARRPPHPRQPDAGHPASPWCPPRGRRTFRLNEGSQQRARRTADRRPGPAGPVRSRGRIGTPHVDATGRLL